MASKILGGKSGLPHGLVVDECKKIIQESGKLKCLDMPKDPITGLTKGMQSFYYEEDPSMAEALQQSKIPVPGCKATISRLVKQSLAQAICRKLLISTIEQVYISHFDAEDHDEDHRFRNRRGL